MREKCEVRPASVVQMELATRRTSRGSVILMYIVLNLLAALIGTIM